MKRRSRATPRVALLIGGAALALMPLAGGGSTAHAASGGAVSLPATGRMLQLFAPTYMSKTTAAYSQTDAVSIANNYDLVAANAKQFTTATLTAMKTANPNIRVLVYVNGSFDLRATQEYPLSQYAVDANGNYIKSKQYHNWLMNIGDPDWVSNVSQQCTTALAQAPFDGCFLDMLGDASLAPAYLTSQPINPATGQVWTQQQQVAATTAIAQRVSTDHPSDIVMGNGLLNGASYFSASAPTSQLFAGADPAMAESWLRAANNSITAYGSAAVWQQNVNMLADAGGNGFDAAVTTKVWINATAAQLTAWHRFALASFLLGTTGSSYFSFTESQGPTEFQNDAGNALDHTQVGAALGAYQAQGKVFSRRYADADVIVNPIKKSVTVTVPAPCVTLDGTVVTTSLVIAADTGQICSYVQTPSVTGVSLPEGSSSGGDSVTITGSGFTDASAVDFGSGNPASSFTVASDTEIDAVTPPGTGTVDVTVTGPEGTSPTTSADEFTYQ